MKYTVINAAKDYEELLELKRFYKKADKARARVNGLHTFRIVFAGARVDLWNRLMETNDGSMIGSHLGRFIIKQYNKFADKIGMRHDVIYCWNGTKGFNEAYISNEAQSYRF